MYICPDCGKDLAFYIAKVKTEYICWSCKKPMKIMLICDPEQEHFDMCSEFAYIKPDNIIEIAKDYGVLMQKRYVKMTREEYIAHICPHCDALQGDYYIVSDNHQWESSITVDRFNIYFCADCNKFFVFNS